MEKPKLLIVLRGGMIQNIYATKEIDVKVIDFDLEKPFELLDSNCLDGVYQVLSDAFTDVSDPEEIEIKEELKRKKL